MGTKLKKCPLCHGDVVLREHDGSGMIECTKCHSQTMDCINVNELISTWNAKTPSDRNLPALKPCPVCGSSADHYHSLDGHRVLCLNWDCGFMTPAFPTIEEATAFWNFDVDAKEDKNDEEKSQT